MLAKLVPPVMVSPDVNVPEGTVRVTVVALGFVIMEAVTALVAPVIVSPRVKLAEDPTVAVMVPAGYDEIPVATVFTTHATSLGRYLAMNDTNFYKKSRRIIS